MTTTANPKRIEELERALENVQAARPIAMEVLRLADDPDADAAQVAACIQQDPILSAQVMRLANSAAFGMAHGVRTTQMAVAVLGFSTIGSVAILVASGLRNLGVPAPRGFWEHSAATAAACSMVSRQFAVSPGDGFALGLLHDLGTPMLNSVDPVTYATITEMAGDGAALCELEDVEFGMNHAAAAATVLRRWAFPSTMVDAIGGHHDALGDGSNEARVLVCGDALAHVATGDATSAHAARLDAMGYRQQEVGMLGAAAAERAEGILSSLLR